MNTNIQHLLMNSKNFMISGEISPDKAVGDDSGPKRIVHKIRSEAKVKINNTLLFHHSIKRRL